MAKIIISIVILIGVIIILIAIHKENKRRKAEYNYNFYISLRDMRNQKTEDLRNQIKFNPDGPRNAARKFELKIRDYENSLRANGYNEHQIKMVDAQIHPLSTYKSYAARVVAKQQEKIDMERMDKSYKDKIYQAKSDGRISENGSINKSSDDVSLPKWLKIASYVVITIILISMISSC